MATLAVGHAPTLVDCDLRAALDAAGVIGTWYWSASNGRFILDEGAASLLAGDGALAGAMLLPDRARARMLESDHARFERRFRIACRLGGSFFTEYRARSAEGYRSVIERGRLFHDEAGRPTHGQGIVLDVTEPADKPFSIVPAVHGERAEALLAKLVPPPPADAVPSEAPTLRKPPVGPGAAEDRRSSRWSG